jgi:hypothetical protein
MATGLGTLGPGQSTTCSGTLHAQGIQDWFTVSFASGTDLTLSVRDNVPGPGGSDFELMVVGGSCSGSIAAQTQGGNDPKTLVFPDHGPHQLLVCVKAGTWDIRRPNFTLTASVKAAAVATSAPVTTPDAFSFSATHLALPGQDYYSNSITITGITTGVPISINQYGYYSVNGGAYKTTPGTVYAGDRVELKSTLDGLDVKRFIELTVGGRSATWELTTLP